MILRYTRSASADLDRLLGDLDRHSTYGASNVLDRIEAAEALLRQFPEVGRLTRLPWLRRLKIRSYPYLIFYEPTDHEIIIHAIRHGAQAPASMPGS